MKDVLKPIKIFAPDLGKEFLSEFLEAPPPPGEPFAEDRVAFLARYSQAILKDEHLRSDPACVALAYWFRESQLRRLQKSFQGLADLETDIAYVPAGKVFHIAPANVDTLFLYSWGLSFLCGNTNLVRLSTKPSPLVADLLRVLNAQMARDEDLACQSVFLTYGHDPKISIYLSRWCTHRILWGGDRTAMEFRQIPLPSHAGERVFGGKFSYAALSAAAWNAASAKKKGEVASGFFNDAFWFGQMACSSPHLLFWVGSRDAFRTAMADFESALEEELKRRKHQSDASIAMKRIAFAFELAAHKDVDVRLRDGDFVSVEHGNPQELTRDICGGGLFRHVPIENLDALASFAGPRDQTLTHFGFPAEEIRALAPILGKRGLDRLVPIGEALAFDATWDGYSLIQDFLRKVQVRI